MPTHSSPGHTPILTKSKSIGRIFGSAENKEPDDLDRELHITSTSAMVDVYNKLAYMEENISKHSKQRERIVCSIVLIVITLVFVVFMAVGAGAGLALFFILRTQEYQVTASVFSTRATARFNTFDTGFRSAFAAVFALQNHMSTAGPEMTIPDWDFFTNLTLSSFSNANILHFVRVVKDTERSNYESYVRSIDDPFYKNFTIQQAVYNGDVRTGSITSPPKDLYFVIQYTKPDSQRTTLFSDILSATIPNSVARNASMLYAYQHRVTTVLKTYVYTNPRGLTLSLIVFAPCVNYRNTSTIFGFARSIIAIEDALDDLLMFSDGLEALVFEGNSTSSPFLYSTQKSVEDQDQAMSAISNAAFAETKELVFFDQKWLFVFVPSKPFYDTFPDRADKWIALFVCITISLLISIFICGIILRAQSIQKVKTLLNDRLKLMETSKASLNTLLDRVGIEEQKTSSILNNLSDAVVSLDYTGKLVFVNSAFKKLSSQFAEREWENKKLQEYLTEIPRESWPNITGQLIETRFYNRLQIPINVQVLFIKTKLSTVENSSIDGYIVTIRNISEQHDLLSSLEKEKQRVVELQFDVNFSIDSWREEFKEFCKKEYNYENALFLEHVLQYKQSKNLESRVKKAKEIFEKFLVIGAKMELNIGAKLREDETYSVRKNIGQIDLFDKLASHVKAELFQNDLLLRFEQEQAKTLAAKQKKGKKLGHMKKPKQQTQQQLNHVPSTIAMSKSVPASSSTVNLLQHSSTASSIATEEAEEEFDYDWESDEEIRDKLEQIEKMLGVSLHKEEEE